MDVSPAKRSYFTCANVWWKLLFHSTIFCELLIEKVNATLRSFGDADKILDQLKLGGSYVFLRRTHPCCKVLYQLWI